MKLAYVALYYDYGKPEQGTSYETDNLEAGFRGWNRNGVEIDYFHPDVEGEMEDLDSRLGEFDAIFHVAFNESIDLPEETARRAMSMGKRVIQWDCDASWRFHNWILPRKNRATDFVTTHSNTVPWYQQAGMRVVRSQWGGSPLYVRDESAEKKYDVSFIGQKHGIRPDIMGALYNAGIQVHLFGNYWDDYPDWHGYLPDVRAKVEVFNQSKICLNLSNPHQVNTLPQIKGRHFEIPQLGGFQLSTPADDLSRYFVPNEEIVLVYSTSELITKIRHYLDCEEERVQVANAGYERMQREHQWEHRFERMFGEMRLL
jgi:spore maturation protein CgeB